MTYLKNYKEFEAEILDLQLEKYGLSFDIKKCTTSGWALGDENVISIRSFKLFCLKWDPCELQERHEKGVFRVTHPHTPFLGQWERVDPIFFNIFLTTLKKGPKWAGLFHVARLYMRVSETNLFFLAWSQEE